MIDRRWYANYKLENVKMFLNRAFAVDDKYIRIASGDAQVGDYTEYEVENENQENEFDDYDPGFAEYEHAVDIVLAYQEIVTRAALNEINLIVEYELKVIASFIEMKRTGKSWQEVWIDDRKKACRTIEAAYNIKLDNLAGANEVDNIRKMINAYKHDDGYSKEYEPFAGEYVEMKKQYKPDFDEINKCVDSAKAFLAAIPGERPKFGEDISRRLKFNIDIGSKHNGLD